MLAHVYDACAEKCRKDKEETVEVGSKRTRTKNSNYANDGDADAAKPSKSNNSSKNKRKIPDEKSIEGEDNDDAPSNRNIKQNCVSNQAYSNEKRNHPRIYSIGMSPPYYILLSLEYDGSLYGGWQRQGKQGEELLLPLPSVQQEVEKAAASCLETDHIVCVQVAGRTDKAVHALDQWCALRVPRVIDTEWFRRQVNISLVEKRIAIKSVTFGPDEKFKVFRKRYKYIIQVPKGSQHQRPNASLHDYSRYEYRSLSLHRLQDALDCMVGTHDFQYLCKKKKGLGRTVRTIFTASVVTASKEEELPQFKILSNPVLRWSLEDHDFLIVTMESNGFLWHQVRRMISLALTVSQSKWPVESIDEVMKGVRVGPASAPARGLYLDHVWLNSNNSHMESNDKRTGMDFT
mmetsp:Transcript_34329/g.39103  ORF Transcript_34329/g.39103 Transcript_34329/m.39103 type:complete len:404 (+) Transcript_34329:104-1315(+)